MATDALTLAFEVGRDQYIVDALAYRGWLDQAAATFRLQVADAGSQTWVDWLTVDHVGAVSIPNTTIVVGSVAWANVTGTPTTLAGYGITDPVVLTSGSYADPTWIPSLGASKLTGTLQAAQFPALTGDVTTVAGALATTLATVNANVGTFGSATQVAQVTVNAKGLVTAVSTVTVTPAASSITGGAALTTANDTNVTLTAGGSAASALLAGASITAGWTGTLGLARGGTGANLSATGGASQVLRQSSVGAAVTVGQLSISDISGGISGSGTAGTIPKWSSASALTDSVASEVSGQFRVTGDISLDGNQIHFLNATNAAGTGYINYDGYNNGTTQTRDLAIADGKHNVFAYFDGVNQRVGIGTTGPGFKTDIWFTGDDGLRVFTSGTANAARLIMLSGNGTTSGRYAYLTSASAETSPQEWRYGMYGDKNWTLYDQTAAASRLTVDTSGNVSIGAAKKLYLDGGGDTYLIESSANVFNIFTAGNKTWGVNAAGDLTYNGNIVLSSGTPSVTGFKGGSVVGTDSAFTVTIAGGIGSGSGSVTFGHTFTNTPAVTMTLNTGGAGAYLYATAVSTTGVTINGSSFTVGDQIMVTVIGH